MGDGGPAGGQDAVRARTGTVAAEGGERLFYRGWRPERPVGRVLVVHGLGDHSGRFEAFGRWLALHGLDARALDLRGHGRSSGRRGHAEAFDRLLGDVGRVEDRAAEEAGPLPTVIVGHSLGGLVALRYLQERPSRYLRGAVAVAPFLRLEMRPPAWKLALGRVADRWLPHLTLPSGTETELVLRDPAERRARRADPRIHDRISARLWGEMQRAAEAVVEETERFETPLLLQAAGDDRVVSSAAVTELAGRLGAMAELRRYPEAFHDLLHDPCARMAASDALGWIRGRVAPEAPRGPWTAYRVHPEEPHGGPRPGAAEPHGEPTYPGEEPMEDREPAPDEERDGASEDRAPEAESSGAEPSARGGHEAESAGADLDEADVPDELLEELEELEEIRDRHLRLAAEYENYRKRTRREMGEARERAQAQLAGRLLDALDDLDRFVASTDEETDAESLREGVEMVRRKLWKELSDAGLERMEAEGERFDPEVHDALLTTPVDDPEEDGLVSRVLITGYLFGDRVLRPARVEVKRYAGEADEEGDATDGDEDTGDAEGEPS